MGFRNQYEDSDSDPEEDYCEATKKKEQTADRLEELSSRLRIESNIDTLMRKKCRQYAK